MFLVQVHSLSGQVLLRSNFGAGASIRRICRAVEQIAGWRRHTCRLMKEAGLSAPACIQHSAMKNKSFNRQHPVAMKLHSYLLYPCVLLGMFLFHSHACPGTIVHESVAHIISGFAARRARLDAVSAPGEKIIFQAARAEYKCLACAWSPGPGFRLQVCSGCFQAFYCDGVCQAQHWHMHKAFCR